MHSFIKIRESDCKDCYKCGRHCVVKAIQVKDAHARIITNRCIQCGRCIDVCPQHAIRAISSLDQVKNFIQTKSANVVSLSPTFAVAFPEFSPSQFVRALHKLGFKAVEETSAAAYHVLLEYEKLIQQDKFVISSECPALVNLIEVYHPELIEHLAPVDSAMLAHAKMLKKAYKDKKDENVKVIYIGPCQSAKSENERFAGELDYILSFEDIRQWFREQSIYPEVIDDSPFETPESHIQEKNSRLYPIQGGLLYRIGINPFSLNFLKVNGFGNCKRFLESIKDEHDSLKFAEMFICEDGCLGAPMMRQNSPQLAKMKLLEYVKSNNKIPNIFDYDDIEVDLTRSFKKREIHFKDVEEKDIQELLKKSGKIGTEDELNCGACGYFSCRDKAIAVIQGMAEYEMCIPYMREKAESRANRIIERDPNGVCEVDEELKIVQYNTAFEKIFALPNYSEIAGNDIREYIDVDLFNSKYRDQKASLLKSEKLKKEIEFISFDLVEEGMHVVIVTDITQKSENKDRINALKEQTIEKANEVIHKQMRVAQEIASLLGETTAETKVSLLELMRVFREETKE